MLVQKQTIHQQKACDLSYLEAEEQGRGMVRRVPRPLAAKDIEKKSKFNRGKSGCKKMALFLFLYYEVSVFALLLNYNKVHLVSSLTHQTNFTSKTIDVRNLARIKDSAQTSR